MAWYNVLWLDREKITVAHGKVPSDQTNIPVYLKLADFDSDFFSNVASDGKDIRITTSDGTTEVPIEIVAIDTSGKTGEVHFKAPSLSHTSDTDFYIYYNNILASAYAASDTYGKYNVWDANYLYVTHLEGNSHDSTVNQHTTTDTSMSYATGDGKLGKGASFTRGSSKIDLGVWPSDLRLTNNFTLESLVNPNNTAQYMGIFGPDPTVGTTNPWVMRQDSNAKVTVNNSQIALVGSSAGTLTQNAWNWATFTMDASKNWVIYLAGASSNSGNYSGTTFGNFASNHLIIGEEANSGSIWWGGYMDELRISKISRSADWIATTHNNQSSTTTFYTIGAQEVSAVNVTVTPSKQTVTFTPGTPTIAPTRVISLTPSKQTASFTLRTPTISTTRSTTESLSKQISTFALHSPTVTTVRSVITSPSIQTGTFTQNSLSVSAIQNPTVNAGLQQGSFTQSTPSISAVRNITLNPDTQQLTATLPNVSISVGDGATPAEQALTLTLYTPTVTTVRVATVVPSTQIVSIIQPIQNVQISDGASPDVQVGVFGLYSPTVTTTQNITVVPNKQTVIATQYAPTIDLDKEVDVSVQQSAFNLYSSTITTTRSVTITPNTLSISATLDNIIVEISELNTQALQTLAFALYAPNITTTRSVTVIVNKQTLAFKKYSPTVAGSIVTDVNVDKYGNIYLSGTSIKLLSRSGLFLDYSGHLYLQTGSVYVRV